MSTVKAEIVTVEGIFEHTNADRLSIAVINGFRCVIGKEQFKPGDKALYIPVDAVLPESLEETLLGKSKIKLSNGRVRATKIRGEYSEGFLVSLEALNIPSCVEVGTDFSKKLGILKYEPPETYYSGVSSDQSNKSQVTKVNKLPKYIDTERGESKLKFFEDDELIHISAKLHGTSIRAGYSEVLPYNLFLKIWFFILTLFKQPRPTEFIAGSRNVDFRLPENIKSKFCIKESNYVRWAKQFELDKKLKPGEIVFGEVVGHGIQGNGYNYGFRPGTVGLFIYAVMVDGKYLDFDRFVNFCTTRGFNRVPLLYLGSFKDRPDNEFLWSGRVDCEKDIPCREGFVLATCKEQSCSWGCRKIIKMISPEYLLNKYNTDGH